MHHHQQHPSCCAFLLSVNTNSYVFQDGIIPYRPCGTDDIDINVKILICSWLIVQAYLDSLLSLQLAGNPSERVS